MTRAPTPSGSPPEPRLPELRETSLFGAWLRRYLLPLTLLALVALAAATVYAVRAFELDLGAETPVPAGEPTPTNAPAIAPPAAPSPSSTPADGR